MASRSLMMRGRLAYERGDYRRASALLKRGKAAGDAWLAQYEQMRLAFAESARTGKRSAIAFED